MDKRWSTILVLTEDLLIVPQFEDTGRRLGFSVSVIDRPAAIGAEGPIEPRAVPLTEPLTGADARFLRAVVDLQPALLLVDLSAQHIPWDRWIHTLKTSAATRRIPIVAFGPHVESGQFTRARSAGADMVLARGALLGSMGDIVQRWARSADLAELAEACQGELSELGLRGVGLIQQGQYYEAHHSLEQAWIEAAELEGFLYRSLLQVAVAYHHIEQGNFAGAMKMLLRVRQWLEPLPDACRGIDIQALRAHLQLLDGRLQAGVADGGGEIDRSLLQPIPMITAV